MKFEFDSATNEICRINSQAMDIEKIPIVFWSHAFFPDAFFGHMHFFQMFFHVIKIEITFLSASTI